MSPQTTRFDEETAPEEFTEMGSFNHGYLQLKIGSCFLNLPNFTPSSEFSLDLSALGDTPLANSAAGLKPDIAVYHEWRVNFQQDVLKGERMPTLVVEILSPLQGVKTLVDKFSLYFALGVKSCWLVYPYAQAIAVYHAPDQFQLFGQGDIVDQVAQVSIPLADIFS